MNGIAGSYIVPTTKRVEPQLVKAVNPIMVWFSSHRLTAESAKNEFVPGGSRGDRLQRALVAAGWKHLPY